MLFNRIGKERLQLEQIMRIAKGKGKKQRSGGAGGWGWGAMEQEAGIIAGWPGRSVPTPGISFASFQRAQSSVSLGGAETLI
jgi:hypothetical protein